jgi:amino acid efflux transporter
VVALTGLAEIVAYGAGVISPAALVALPAALFLVVYLGCMASAVRVLRGPARRAAGPATVLVAVVLAFCGWAVLAPLAVALAVCSWPRLSRAAALVPRGRAGRAGDLPARAGPRPAPAETATAHLGHNSADSAVNLECQTHGVA